MAVNHIGIITTDRNMDERILPQILPSHLSIPLGLTLPEIYDESPIQIQYEEILLDQNIFDIDMIDMKKMDHLFQQITVESSKSPKSKETITRKTRKIRKK